MTWTADRVELLTSLHKEGLSASLIGMQLRVTRNAVIGKLNRMGLSRPRPAVRKSRIPKRQPTRQLGGGRSRFAPSSEGQETMAQETFKKVSSTHADDLEIPRHQRKAFEQLKPGMCKFPVGSPKDSDFFFCGAQCDRMAPYCDAHAKRCGGQRW